MRVDVALRAGDVVPRGSAASQHFNCVEALFAIETGPSRMTIVESSYTAGGAAYGKSGHFRFFAASLGIIGGCRQATAVRYSVILAFCAFTEYV